MSLIRKLSKQMSSPTSRIMPSCDEAAIETEEHSIDLSVSQVESELGVVDYNVVKEKIHSETSKRGCYRKYTDKQRFEIGRYASENGPVAAVRRFQKTFHSLNKGSLMWAVFPLPPP